MRRAAKNPLRWVRGRLPRWVTPQTIAIATLWVLAAVGVYWGHVHFTRQLSEADAYALVGSIASAQEAYFAENGTYSVAPSSRDSRCLFADPGKVDAGGTDPPQQASCKWREFDLRVGRPPTDFGYGVIAGEAPEVPPPIYWCKGIPRWNTPTGPWYVVAAKSLGAHGESKCVVSSPLLGSEMVVGVAE